MIFKKRSHWIAGALCLLLMVVIVVGTWGRFHEFWVSLIIGFFIITYLGSLFLLWETWWKYKEMVCKYWDLRAENRNLWEEFEELRGENERFKAELKERTKVIEGLLENGGALEYGNIVTFLGDPQMWRVCNVGKRFLTFEIVGLDDAEKEKMRLRGFSHKKRISKLRLSEMTIIYLPEEV